MNSARQDRLEIFGSMQRLRRAAKVKLGALWRLALLAALLASPAAAVIETYTFDTAEQELRYQQFTAELRCPKCQNQNLADSNSPISEDLRRELHRMLLAGHSDEEITAFMVSRYGEFILYRPPLDRNTAVLWLFPLLLLLVAAVALLAMLRRSRQVAQPAAVDEEGRQRAGALLQQFREGDG